MVVRRFVETTVYCRMLGCQMKTNKCPVSVHIELVRIMICMPSLVIVTVKFLFDVSTI